MEANKFQDNSQIKNSIKSPIKTNSVDKNHTNINQQNKIINYDSSIDFQYLSKQKKAEIFTKDSKIFIRSISDSVVATKQINRINTLRNLDNIYNCILNHGIKNNDFLLYKSCNHRLCENNLIACKNKTSYEVYLMTKFCLNVYMKNHKKLKEINNFYEYNNFLDEMLIVLKKDLKDYSGYIKTAYANDLNSKI